MDRWQPSELERLKRLAREAAMHLGAVAVRVASAQPDAAARKAMEEAFARGDFATWPYDAAHAHMAADPQHLLSGARAVICIAVPYRTQPPEAPPLSGRVSNYAWSPDYHYRVKAMLREIAAKIDEAAGESVTAIACDTKPLAERAFAARSGLAWIGKHTNAITPEAGSFVFLGEIVTSLPLEADPPLKKNCGACARCIPACPTGALRGDYSIDATRCISDLTQRTDPVPHELRPLIGMWVWGCDLCQLACPPNARAEVGGSALDGPVSRETATPALVDLLRLRSGEFKRTYRRTAMGWRGAAVLRRNAALALGNALDRSAVPYLAQALASDPHAMVRGQAAWSLGRIGSPPALESLRDRLELEQDEDVRAEIRSALEPFRSSDALQPV